MNREESRHYAAAEAFFTAYNDVNEAELRRLLAQDVTWGHRNKFEGRGRDELIESIHKISGWMESRSFGIFLRWAERENVFFCEHDWFAVPLVDDPVWGWEKGKPHLAHGFSVLEFTDGRISDWTDYG